MAPSESTFHDHVKEFRKRLVWVFLAVGISAGIAYASRIPITNALIKPLNATTYYTSPAGSFNFILKLSLAVGTFIAVPVVIYHLLRFLEPALPLSIKRRTMFTIIGSSFLLAAIGMAFAFFLMLPLSLNFFNGYSTDSIKPLINANEYLSFVLNHLITFALAFQIPMVFLFINRITPLKPSKILKYQRHVIVGAFGIAIVLPFTYDPLSQFIVAVPIVFLYYMSVVLLWIINRNHVFPQDVPKQVSLSPDAKPVFVPNVALPQAVAFPPVTPQLSISRPRAMDGFITAPGIRARLTPKPNLSIPAIAEPRPQPTRSSSHRSSRAKFAIDGISPTFA